MPDGRLYAITAAGPGEGFRNTLVRIDPKTGDVESLKDFGRRGIQAMTHTHNRLLVYSVRDAETSKGFGLIWIDPDTRDTAVAIKRPPTSNLQSMAFAPDGSLIGALGDGKGAEGHATVLIDPQTNQIKILGSMRSWDVRGIGFLRGR
jgi:hypothetical protein